MADVARVPLASASIEERPQVVRVRPTLRRTAHSAQSPLEQVGRSGADRSRNECSLSKSSGERTFERIQSLS